MLDVDALYTNLKGKGQAGHPEEVEHDTNVHHLCTVTAYLIHQKSCSQASAPERPHHLCTFAALLLHHNIALVLSGRRSIMPCDSVDYHTWHICNEHNVNLIHLDDPPITLGMHSVQCPIAGAAVPHGGLPCSWQISHPGWGPQHLSTAD